MPCLDSQLGCELIMRIVAYARTSTRGQDVQAQLESLRAAAQARGRSFTHEALEQSSGRGQLKVLDEIERDARRGQVRQLWVVALDRIGRSTIEVLMRLDRLTRAGCAVVSIREGIDLSTPVGRLQAEVLASVAQFEAEMIASRTREALAVARARGRRLGRPPVKFDIGRARSLRALGYSWRTIALDVGASEGTVRRYLRATIPPLEDGLPGLT